MKNNHILEDASGTVALDAEALVDRYYKPLYRFALGLSGSESDAADLTQETYYVLLTKGRQIRDAGKAKNWLFTTLYRKFLGRRRYASRFPSLSLEGACDELPVVEPPNGERLDAVPVISALQSMDDRYRAPLTLFYLQRFSYREIAEVLGLPIGTVMSRLARGKQRLREQLVAEREAFQRKTRERTNAAECGSQAGRRPKHFNPPGAPSLSVLGGLPKGGGQPPRPDSILSA